MFIWCVGMRGKKRVRNKVVARVAARVRKKLFGYGDRGRKGLFIVKRYKRLGRGVFGTP